MDDCATRLCELNNLEFESVVRLSAYHETQPPLAELRANLEPRVDHAIESGS